MIKETKGDKEDMNNFNLLAELPLAIADMVIVALAAIFVIVGFAKGFFKGIEGGISKLIALIIALILAGRAATILQKWFGLTEVFSGSLSGLITKIFSDKVNIELPAGTDLQMALSEVNVPKFLINVIMKSDALESGCTVADGITLNQILSPVLAGYLLFLVSLIVCYILARIILKIVLNLADGISKLPVLNIIFRLLGGALGLVKIAFIAWLLTIVMKVLPAGITQKAYTYIDENTKVMKYIIDSNILGDTFGKVINTDFINEKLKGTEEEGLISEITLSTGDYIINY